MTDKVMSTTIDILGKSYPVRCLEGELTSLQAAAAFLNQKMLEVQRGGKVINVERIAVITALNITHQFLQGDQHANRVMSKINQHIGSLQEKLEGALNGLQQAELVYSTVE